ncbi:MAG: glutamate--cysteine ligase [Cyclobacteriaceae bacterium]|nr:MAG: glutamate--cysteine ligase [Cyclobacteriaceae bacterium]
MIIPSPHSAGKAHAGPPYRYHLFQAYGVELEYMIVDCDTLQVKPIADDLLKHELGYFGADCVRGPITWSNEMVLHVIELKSTQPEGNLSNLGHLLADEVRYINHILKQWDARLLPGGCHPAFRPEKETRLWPHESNEIYEAYNRIFNCRGHGWSNLQSTHLNLPFYDDEEFAQLHAAVRVVLPLIPALCASSPMVEETLTGSRDTRLKYYKNNQSRIPSITGRIIPEAVFSRRTYLKNIYEKIKADLRPHDPQGILNPVWVNSRGAVPRFDRGSVEIRLIDSQECPAADIAVSLLLAETIRALAGNMFAPVAELMKCPSDMLTDILDRTIEEGEDALLPEEYVRYFEFDPEKYTAGSLWKKITGHLINRDVRVISGSEPELKIIFDEGTLATRIIRAVKQAGAWQPVYRQLADCLEQNKMFIP